LLTQRRQTTFSFLSLAATMALWQFTKLAKNGGIPFLNVDNLHWWATLSFLGATFIYPSLFVLALQLSGRRLRRFREAIVFAIASAILLTILYGQGYLTDGLILNKYGYYNHPRLAYLLYTVTYTIFMVWGIILLWKRPPERLALPYPSRILFWASTLGFGFGSLEFYSIWVRPLYPLADLSTAFYSAVFYWAIFRYNYMGGRSLLRLFFLRLLLGLGIFSLLLISFLVMLRLVPWFERPWVPAVLIALVLSALVPILNANYTRIRSKLFPSRYSGREMLLGVSSLVSQSSNTIEMAEQVLDEIQKRFGFPRAALVLFRTSRPSENPPHVISHHLHISAKNIPGLEHHYRGAISRRELLDSLRQSGVQGSARRPRLLRYWRLLRRIQADVLVPGTSAEGLELVLLIEEGRYRTEDWLVTAPLLEGVCKMLADHLHLRRIMETRVQEKHLGDLGLMAAGLAHEIKNPLEGIYGAAQLLQEESKGNTRFVNMILTESMRLNDIVHSFLKFARPFPTQNQKIKLDEYLTEFANSQKVQGLAISLELSQASVLADPSGLQQILVNLVQNAWRAQQNPDPVLISCEPNGAWIDIRVMDHGPGIPAEQSQHLFKPFYTTHAQGNGLGLAMSRKIARAMGGDLFYSPGSYGAIFTVRLSTKQG